MLDFIGAGDLEYLANRSVGRLRALEAGLAAEGLQLNPGQILAAARRPAGNQDPARR